MNTEARRERERCVSICRRRAAMWSRAAARNPAAGGLGVAQARANEATYLADLLESGSDLDLTIPKGDEADV